jgi:hypothetical protein
MFYGALRARTFYILSNPVMTPIFDTQDPRETVVLTFDVSNDLAHGETLAEKILPSKGIPTVSAS